ncbi:hypothetical protein PAECIP111893_00264 [Paenibacillus plantiphilus]|uniref:Uncharacterized protein n=1 Tax=Paenibacillus plantiphilus TaxID=2905650 RepID=A0ABM9BP45_9BACL|nr:hypothetical protein [Paenibacillus plantiphilus]CAH1190300.1 hypothetical protein PAECIP111893_00264 [Paenibacillus plantiphilus]
MGTISKQEAEQRARLNWAQWRLLLSDMSITYSDLLQMDDDDIAEANAALDIHMRAMEKKTSKK